MQVQGDKQAWIIKKGIVVQPIIQDQQEKHPKKTDEIPVLISQPASQTARQAFSNVNILYLIINKIYPFYTYSFF